MKKGIIAEEVFAQIGFSNYVPQNYNFKDFLKREEYVEVIKKCSIVITHGGTGAIITSLKADKKVIAVPRLAKYGEHVDDHQIQLLKQFKELNLISVCDELDELGDLLKKIKTQAFEKYQSNTEQVIQSIECYLEGLKK